MLKVAHRAHSSLIIG